MNRSDEVTDGAVEVAYTKPASHSGSPYSQPPPLPHDDRGWRWLEFAPDGLAARAAYIAVGVLLSATWAITAISWLHDWRLSVFCGEVQPWTTVRWLGLATSVVSMPLIETGVGYAMLVGLSAMRVRPSLQLWAWAALWAHSHYWYQGNALVVFGPFVVMGACMITYRRRSRRDALWMTALMHMSYNALLEPLKSLLRWLCA